MPITFSGRLALAAISVIGSEEVLLAKMVFSLEIRKLNEKNLVAFK